MLQWAINLRTLRLLWVIHVSTEAQEPLPKLCDLSHPHTCAHTAVVEKQFVHEVCMCVRTRVCTRMHARAHVWRSEDEDSLVGPVLPIRLKQVLGIKFRSPGFLLTKPSHWPSWNDFYPYCVTMVAPPPPLQCQKSEDPVDTDARIQIHAFFSVFPKILG